MGFLLKAKLLQGHGRFMTMTNCIFHDPQSQITIWHISAIIVTQNQEKPHACAQMNINI